MMSLQRLRKERTPMKIENSINKYNIVCTTYPYSNFQLPILLHNKAGLLFIDSCRFNNTLLNSLLLIEVVLPTQNMGLWIDNGGKGASR
jgi:hypothetical protein